MDKFAMRSWFSALSSPDKVAILLNVMYELTLVVRSVFLDYPKDCETRAKLAYAISELNHRLTAAATDTMQGQDKYADALIEMLFERPKYPELQPYFPFVLEQAVERVKNARKNLKINRASAWRRIGR
jgi:hypothetical protein